MQQQACKLESLAAGKRGKKSRQQEEKTNEFSGGHHDEDSRVNLDSGYAWIILLVMFLIASTIGGSTRVYGLVFAKEVEIGYYDREQASLPIATASAVECLAGIFSPAVVLLLSWRNIELISSSLFVLANVLAYFSSSLALDILALGVTQGLALSIYSVLGLLINNDYFERYRTTAYGVSLSGSTFGLLYLNPLVNWLLDSYDNFRLVYLALACVFSGNLLLVLFIRPRSEAPKLTWLRACFGGNGLKMQANDESNKGNCKDDGPQCGGRIQRKKSRLETHFLESRNSVASISYMVRSRRASAMSRVINEPTNRTATLNLHPDSAQQQQQQQPLTLAAVGQQTEQSKKISTTSSVRSANFDGIGNERRQKLAAAASGGGSGQGTHSASRQNSILMAAGHNSDETATAAGGHDDEMELDVARLYRQLALEHELQTSQNELALGSSRDQKPLDQGQRQPQQQQGFSLANLIGLLRLPYLHCTWIMLALYNLIARIYVIILVDFARDHGLDHYQSTNLLNYWSFGELLGRLFLGSLIDMQFLSCRSCIGLTCALLAGVMFCMVLIESYLVYALCSMLVAALVSLEYMLINVMMVEYIGKQMVTNCYSLAAGISSLVLFGRPQMIGFFRDHLGSYDGLLLTLASLAGAFAVLFYLLEPLFVHYWPKSARPITLKPT